MPFCKHPARGGSIARGAILRGGVVCALLATASAAHANCDPRAAMHHQLPGTIDTTQQGFFSREFAPILTAQSGDFLTIEMISHHADKDERMWMNDPSVEGIFAERTSGHILTGPVEICGAEPGDILEVRILDLYPRPSQHPDAFGKTYGANLAGAGGGFLFNPAVTEATGEGEHPRSIVIYEVDASGVRPWAKADYMYDRDAGPDTTSEPALAGVRIPIRPHFGILGVAPAEAELVRSGPPSHFGGNIDDWRIGQGATMYYPVQVPGALLVAGDPHAAQGDSELSGTAIEMSLTGVVQVVLHKEADTTGTILAGLDYPLLETADEFIVHGFSFANYLEELGEDPQEAQDTIYDNPSLDQAMYDAAQKMAGFLTGPMGLSHNEAYSLMSVGVDFGVTQVANGNWGIHATLQKAVLGEVDVLGSLGAVARFDPPELMETQTASD
jgi:acetamidase/formamidase